MGEITESTRRHYIGADADKDTIPAGGKAFGDSYHANDKGKQYYWNGAAWKTGLGYEYVPRAVAAADFAIGNFTVDGTWKVDGLDVSGIVPVGAIAVAILYAIRATAGGVFFTLRGNATTKAENSHEQMVALANVYSPLLYGVIYCDADRLIDYRGPNTVDRVKMSVVGWFI